MDRFEHSVEVDAPVSECYNRWHRFEDFPEFMTNVQEVSPVGENVWHWVVNGPLGKDIEWDAVIDRDEPNREIAWHSIDEDPEMTLSGSVRFEENGPERTRVTSVIQYEAPLGALGDIVAGLFSNPQQMVIEDLENFKNLVETGVSHYTGPYATEPAPPDDERNFVDLESDDPLDQVETPYLGADGALGGRDILEARQDTDHNTDNLEVYGQEFVEIDIFTSSMDVYSEDLESFVEDLDEDIDSSYVITEEIEVYLEEERVEQGDLTVPTGEGSRDLPENRHIGGTNSPGTGEELQR